jgi:hypothetical protein
MDQSFQNSENVIRSIHGDSEEAKRLMKRETGLLRQHSKKLIVNFSEQII